MKSFRIELFLCLIVVVVLVVVTQPARASSAAGNRATEVTGSSEFGRSQEMEKILDVLATNPQVEWVTASKQRVRGFAITFRDRITNVEAEIKQLRTALEGIGEINSDGSIVPNQALTEIIALKQKKELELAELRLLVLMTREVTEKLDNYLQEQEKKSLYTRSDPLWILMANFSLDTIVTELNALSLENVPKVTSVFPAVVFIFIWFLAFFHLSREFIITNGKSNNSIRVFLLRLTQTPLWVRFVVLGICSLAIPASILEPGGWMHPGIIVAVLFLFYIYAITGITHILSCRFSKDSDSPSRGPTPRNLIVFLAGSLTALLLTLSPVSSTLGDTPTYVSIINGFVSLILFLLLQLIRRSTQATLESIGRNLVLFLFKSGALILFCMEMFGFQNLSSHFISQAGFTLSILAMSILFYDSIDLIIALFRTATNHLLAKAGMTESEPVKRFRTHKILNMGMKLYLVLGTVVLVLHHWGVTQVDNDQLRDFFLEGIPLSGMTLSPARITVALLIVVFCWPMVLYLKKVMEEKWLKAEEFSSSSRDSIVTISGYLCYGTILLVALGIAGVKMTGLAVIVGALSVGIGFGLQNIVNNFISGLILMFERPIKKGDWILVGATEGYVKKISIRSTIVQTFDRSDVIIPNSELISNQVTNMMLDDSRGRLRVSVGVAYGTDTELVRMILLDAAKKHPQVITDGSTPEPKAWFQGFGDSSLNFDLLCHLKDIDLKLRVRSELHTTINQAFKEKGIAIPFPQRDIHIIKENSQEYL